MKYALAVALLLFLGSTPVNSEKISGENIVPSVNDRAAASVSTSVAYKSTLSASSGSPSPISAGAPEPSALSLLGFGMLGAGFLLRRKRRSGK